MNVPSLVKARLMVKSIQMFFQRSLITADIITGSMKTSQLGSSTKSSVHFVRKSFASQLTFTNTQTVITKLKYPSTGSPATRASKEASKGLC